MHLGIVRISLYLNKLLLGIQLEYWSLTVPASDYTHFIGRREDRTDMVVVD